MFRPSNPNPIPELLFNFRITPLKRFKLALNALVDQHFNPIGFGLLEVKQEGVQITAQNVDTRATGVIRLYSSALMDFYCNQRYQETIIRMNFRKILMNISDIDESITLFRFAGSNVVIHFVSGINPVRELSLRCLPMVPDFVRFDDTSFCAAKLPSNMLREMIIRLQWRLSLGINDLVSASLSQALFSVYIGNVQPLQLQHRFNDGVTGTWGLVPGQVHHAWFIWPHLEALRKASHIDPYFVIAFAVQPREVIITKHSLEPLGYLIMFSNRATRVLPNINRAPPEVASALAAAATAAAAAAVPL